jgi:hypothetical protein
MVKLGDDFNKKKEQPVKEIKTTMKDFGEFLEEYWWTLLIIGFLIFGGIEGIIKAGNPDAPKYPAVVVEVVSEKLDDYKVKFIDDGTVAVVDLKDGFVVGDTVLTEK